MKHTISFVRLYSKLNCGSFEFIRILALVLVSEPLYWRGFTGSHLHPIRGFYKSVTARIFYFMFSPSLYFNGHDLSRNILNKLVICAEKFWDIACLQKEHLGQFWYVYEIYLVHLNFTFIFIKFSLYSFIKILIFAVVVIFLLQIMIMCAFFCFFHPNQKVTIC